MPTNNPSAALTRLQNLLTQLFDCDCTETDHHDWDTAVFRDFINSTMIELIDEDLRFGRLAQQNQAAKLHEASRRNVELVLRPDVFDENDDVIEPWQDTIVAINYRASKRWLTVGRPITDVVDEIYTHLFHFFNREVPQHGSSTPDCLKVTCDPHTTPDELASQLDEYLVRATLKISRLTVDNADLAEGWFQQVRITRKIGTALIQLLYPGVTAQRSLQSQP